MTAARARPAAGAGLAPRRAAQQPPKTLRALDGYGCMCTWMHPLGLSRLLDRLVVSIPIWVYVEIMPLCCWVCLGPDESCHNLSCEP